MFVITYRKFFYAFSLITVAVSIAAVAIYGLSFGIDFKGGSLLEVSYKGERPAVSLIKEKLATLSLGDYSVREANNDAFIIRTKSISDAEKNTLLQTITLDASNTPQEKIFNTVGPTLGKELQNRAAFAILIVILSIVLFIAFAFRHVSKPVSSFKYGLVAIIALVHDVILPLGFFAILGHFYGLEVDTLFVTALLVVLGYSINDTIVIFDRIRENLRATKDGERDSQFENIVGRSLSETFGRSINTSLTVLLALVILYFVGGESTHSFSLALLVGVTAGTYSSIFLAAPILVSFKKLQDKKAVK